LNFENLADVLKKKLSSILLHNRTSILFMVIAEVETVVYQSSWVFVFNISSSTAMHKL